MEDDIYIAAGLPAMTDKAVDAVPLIVHVPGRCANGGRAVGEWVVFGIWIFGVGGLGGGVQWDRQI